MAIFKSEIPHKSVMAGTHIAFFDDEGYLHTEDKEVIKACGGAAGVKKLTEKQEKEFLASKNGEELQEGEGGDGGEGE